MANAALLDLLYIELLDELLVQTEYFWVVYSIEGEGKRVYYIL